MNSPAVTPLPLTPGRPYPGCRRDDPLSLHISDTRDPHKVRRLLESEGVLARDEDGQYVAAVTAGEMAAARDTADTALAAAHDAQATAGAAQAAADDAQAAAGKARSALDAVARVDVSDLTNDNKRTAAIQAIVTAVRGALVSPVLLVLFCLPVFAVPHGEVDDSVDVNLDTVTNALPSSSARVLPPYLHVLGFDDSYPADAAWYYAQRGDGKVDGGCSAVRDGGFLYRNFDFPFDDRAEFVVKMSAGAGRFASVGVAQAGTNLTERFVTSGKPSRYYKCLPGATVDGINENGVVAEVNVVGGVPAECGWTNDVANGIHPLGAVRWVLDHGTSAGMAASNLAARIMFPPGWKQNFHWMIADERETWIVEHGWAFFTRSQKEQKVLTNFHTTKEVFLPVTGRERYGLLLDHLYRHTVPNITNVWYTNAYRRETNPPWVSDLAEVLAYTNEIFNAWAAHDKEYFRGKTNNGVPWWQSVHTSVYDISNRVLRVAVQEQDDWYTFAVPSGGGTDEAKVREIASEVVAPVASSVSRLQSSKADKADLEAATNTLSSSVSTLSSSVSRLQSSKADKADLDDYLPLSGGTVNGVFLGDMLQQGWFGTPGIGTMFMGGSPNGYSWRITLGPFGLAYLKYGDLDITEDKELAVKGDISDALYDFVDKGTVNYISDIDFGILDGVNNGLEFRGTGMWLRGYVRVDTNGMPTANRDGDFVARLADIPVISAADPTFSNAVLSVGINTNVLAAVAQIQNLGTNTVRQIADFVSAFDGIGITLPQGVTTLVGLLAALVAAVTWLKKNALTDGLETDGTPTDEKLDKFFGESNSLLIDTIENHSGGGDITEADLPYDIVSPTAGSETIDDVVYTRYDLQNRAINNIVIDTAAPAPLTLHLPAPLENEGKGRDLIVRVKVADAVTTIPSMQIVAASGETVGFEADNNEWATLKYGVNFYCFTETERSAANG